MYERPIPLATVERLSVYLRTLKSSLADGQTHISSSAIAEYNGYTPAQVRKDLTCFGSFGRKGQGYPIEQLISHIQHILGIDTSWNICIIGLGNLGKTLAHNMKIFNREFNLTAIFENEVEQMEDNFDGVPIISDDFLAETIEREKIDIGIVAVPEEAAERVITSLYKTQIRGVLNFTAVRVPPPDHIFVKDVNIGGHLETIAFYLTNPGKKC